MRWVHVKRTTCVLGAFALLTFAAMYMLGAICWGHESYDIHSTHGFSRSQRGSTLGPKQFYLRAGETLRVNYDVTIRKGHLHVHLFKPYKPFGSEQGQSRFIRTSGKGEIAMPIRESCYYVLSIEAHLGDGGCDLSYDATWSRR